MLQEGELLDARYRLKARIGEGGMGSVWVAENVAIKGSEVALKVMHSTFAHDATVVSRFRAEAEATVRIGHPNIVKVFDFGELADGTPYLVMERLYGESLAERLERVGALAPREAVTILRAVLDALEAAHEKDIVHRDLKPENLFLAGEGAEACPKILDFGVSKILGGDAERVRLTRTGALVGTPAYMAPEQALGEAAVDIRADLWAMGVILYELVSGRLPYDGQNYNAMLVQIVTGRPRPVTDHVPSLDPGLVQVIERAMSRSPRARYPSARAMNDALGEWLATEGARRSLHAPPRNPTPVRLTPMAFESAETLPGHDTVVDGAAARRRPWGWVAVATTLAVLGFATRGRWARPSTAQARAATTSAPMAAATVQLLIQGLPRGAHVSVDDEPVMLPMPLRADRVHRVRVEAPGFQPWGAEVPPSDRDVALRYEGAARAAEPAPEAPPPTPRLAPTPEFHRAPPARRAPRAAPRAPRGRGGMIADPGF
ncbi:MAG: serine/threonine-protein kinase [Polyangiales bacterium]